MRAELLTCRKYFVFWFLRLRRIVRLHVESSMKVTREDADLFVSRLKKTSPAKSLPQIKEGQEKKIVNFRNKCAAQKTIKDLPLLLANPQEHWFENDIEGMGGRIKKSSASYFRLQAFVSTLANEAVNEIDKPSEPAGEHA
jgi:hypothetical protein